jgi:hypothetical protein
MPEMQEYVLRYSETFLVHGTVDFKYRAYTKIINKHIKSGVMSFFIDGIDQNIASDHLMAGTWIDVGRDVDPGFHHMEWRYRKYLNVGSVDGKMTEDAAAEIEFIRIKGIKHSDRECRRCRNGVANMMADRCQ